MCLRIVPKADLTEEQLRYIGERVSAPEHVDDAGPPTVWNIYQHGLYAVIDGDSNTPVGIIEVSGLLYLLIIKRSRLIDQDRLEGYLLNEGMTTFNKLI